MPELQRFFFQHRLTREAAYSSLLDSNRRTLHSLAADALAGEQALGAAAEWELLPLLAAHLEAAGRLAEAHACCCELLSLLAQTGRFDSWAETQRAAQRCWTSGAGQSPALLLAQAQREYSQGRMHDALALFDAAGQLARAATGGPDPRLLGDCRSGFASACCRLGRMDEADQAFAEALALHSVSGDLARQCNTRRLLGVLRRDQCRWEEARQEMENALQLARQCGNLRLEAITLLALGILQSFFGNVAEMRPAFEAALAAARKAGDMDSEATALASLGEALALCGLGQEAEDCICAALELSKRTGNQRTRMLALGFRSMSMMALYRWDDAHKAMAEASQIARSLNFRWGDAFVGYHWGVVAQLQGDWAGARQLFTDSIMASQALGHQTFAGIGKAYLAWQEAASGNPQHAELLLAEVPFDPQQHNLICSIAQLCAGALIAAHRFGVERGLARLAEAEQRCLEFEGLAHALPPRLVKQTRELLEKL